MSHAVTLETYHVIGIPLVTSGLLTFSGAVISQTANAARNTLSLKCQNGATGNAYSKPTGSDDVIRSDLYFAVRTAVCTCSDRSPCSSLCLFGVIWNSLPDYVVEIAYKLAVYLLQYIIHC